MLLCATKGRVQSRNGKRLLILLRASDSAVRLRQDAERFRGTGLGILGRPSPATLAVWFSLSQAKHAVSLAARVCSNTIVAECGARTRHG